MCLEGALPSFVKRRHHGPYVYTYMLGPHSQNGLVLGAQRDQEKF